jgi:hypothetical protein
MAGLVPAMTVSMALDLCRVVDLQHAAADLVFLDRFEQRLEVAFAKTVVALALDELEEDRPDRVGGENLQQYFGMAAVDHAFTVDQDAIALKPRDVLAMFWQPRIDLLSGGGGMNGRPAARRVSTVL